MCKDYSDADVASWSELTNVDIILTTPEKFDSITRKNKDRGGMAFGDVTVMIDEVHILDERGALEAVISRLKVLSERASCAPHLSVPFASPRVRRRCPIWTTWGDGSRALPEGLVVSARSIDRDT